MRLINLEPGRSGRMLLNALPFVLLLIVYVIASDARLQANPNDKLLPSFATIAHKVGSSSPRLTSAPGTSSSGRTRSPR